MKNGVKNIQVIAYNGVRHIYVKKLVLHTRLRDLEFRKLNFQLEDKVLKPIMRAQNGLVF